MKSTIIVHEHPEMTDIRHICDVFPNTPGTKDVCEKFRAETIHQLKLKSKGIKKR